MYMKFAKIWFLGEKTNLYIVKIQYDLVIYYPNLIKFVPELDWIPNIKAKFDQIRRPNLDWIYKFSRIHE